MASASADKRAVARNVHRRYCTRATPLRRSRVHRALIRPAMRRTMWFGLALIGVWGTMAACMSGLYRAMEGSQMFALEGIEILGNSKISSREILDKAGIAEGMNILTLKNDEISRRIEEIPWIAHVSIIKRFPHRLTIRIAERQPAAIVAAGGLCYVDGDGVVFYTLGAGDRRDFPLLTGFRQEEVLSHMNSVYEPIAKTMDLLQIIQNYPGMFSISEISFDARKGWTVYPLKYPVPMYLGFGDLEQKIINLARIYHDLFAQNPPPDLVNLSFPYQVVMKKAKEDKGTCTTMKAIPSHGKRVDSGPATRRQECSWPKET